MGPGTKKIAKFVRFSAKAVCRVKVLKAAHTSDVALDPTTILLQSIL
jgi:hypothetical protein